MSTNRLLVIAPDTEFRKSLDFALSAEGYAVTALPDYAASSPEAFDVIVVHGAALAGRHEDALAFLSKAKASVLLSERPLTWLRHRFDQYVEPPLLGPALTEAVHRILCPAVEATK